MGCLAPAERLAWWLFGSLFRSILFWHDFCSVSAALLIASPFLSVMYIWVLGKILRHHNISALLVFLFYHAQRRNCFVIRSNWRLYNVHSRSTRLFSTLFLVHTLSTFKIFRVNMRSRISLCALRFPGALSAYLWGFWPCSSTILLLTVWGYLASWLSLAILLYIIWSTPAAIWIFLFRDFPICFPDGLYRVWDEWSRWPPERPSFSSPYHHSIINFAIKQSHCSHYLCFLNHISSLSRLPSTATPSYVNFMPRYLVATSF